MEYITKLNQIEGLPILLGSVIVLTEKFGFDFVRLPNIIELNRSIVFDYRTFDCLPRAAGMKFLFSNTEQSLLQSRLPAIAPRIEQYIYIF